MKKKLFYIVTLLSLTLTTCYAQYYRIKPTEAEMDEARTYKAQYKDDEFLITSTEVKYTFERLKDKNSKIPFVINENTSTSITCLKEGINSAYSNTSFYDQNSEVVKFSAFDKNGKADVSGMATFNQTYSNEGIFHDDTKLFIYTIDFSDIGQKEKYTVFKKYKDPKYLTSIYFHGHYPALEKSIVLEIPDWAEVDILLKNTENYSIIKTEEKNSKTNSTIYKYTLKNINADKAENDQPGASFYLPHLVLIHKSYTKIDGTKENVFRDTKDLYTWYSSLAGAVENNKEALKSTVDKLITGKLSDMEKVEALFYWVQENIRYIAFEDGIAAYKPASCQDVLNNKYGDCKGMANLLKNMLVLAGFDARLTWIGTNHIAYNHSTPALLVDNHMICTLILKGKKYYLDPTETYIAISDYAHRIQGREVLIENGSTFILDTVPAFSKERNTIRIEQKFTIENDLLKGSSRDIYNGEGKTSIIRSYNIMKSDKREEAIKKYLNENDKNMTVTGISMTDMHDRKNPLEFFYDMSLKNQVSAMENEKYITLDYQKEYKNFIFDTTRMKDYVFDNKYYLVKSIVFSVPDGYSVKHLPADMNKSTKDFSIKVSFMQKDKQVLYNKEISIDNGIIRKKDFKLWNSYIKELKKIYNDQIIISKN
jgi:hypothetical protein